MTFLRRLTCRLMISLRYCFEMSSKRLIQDHFQTFHSKVVRKRVNKKKNARGKTGTVLEKSMCHLILCHVKSITGKVFYYSRPLDVHLRLLFIFLSKSWLFIRHIGQQSLLVFSGTRPCLFLSLSLPFYATDFILFLLHTPRPRSSAAALFHLRYSPALGPLQLKTDAITFPDRNGWAAKGALFSSRFFYTQTVRFGHQEQIVGTQEKQKCYRLNLSLNAFLSSLIIPSFWDRSKSKQCAEERR